ncbi:hypothetical protein [Alkalicoccus daliensis]|uniref:GAF domain-containing protein n=1 Tax=Alkalicoccus daliensis TaxID=745820 RepID=A0A1G9ZQH0_9BACI|nr:hypothetical protein [Alkalicoccus daliensis]SDN23548.1 hypothetical protein SAMN04488053_101203 [Alkalicoccus daliensis]
MRKSDFLDELRLEIGLAYDYALNQQDFIMRILKTIHAVAKKQITLTIHSYKNKKLELSYALGIRGLTREQELLGQGFLFADTMKMVTYVQRGRDHVLYLPIYDKDKLLYIISIKLMDTDYVVSKQDIIFAQELIQFIQAKQSSFQK